VRELRNAIERAVLICRNGRIEADHLLLEAIRPGAPAAAPGRVAEMPAPESLRVDRDTEKRRIEEALASCGGNQSRAAKLLGIARSTLVLRLEAHGITRPRKRE
jgi:DNA-binding NtrC family response regulator